MSRECPACHHRIPIGSFRGVRRTIWFTPRSQPWYRYVPPRFSCPRCGAELYAKTQPLGHVLNLLVAAGTVAFVIWCWLHPSVRIWPIPLIGLFGFCLVMGLCISKWGISFSEAKADSRHDELRSR